MHILPENNGPHCIYKIIGRAGAAQPPSGYAPDFTKRLLNVVQI